MKVRDAIEKLKDLGPDQEIIIGWWTDESFEEEDKAKDYKRVFNENINIIEDRKDWSCDYDSMILIMDEILEEE